MAPAGLFPAQTWEPSAAEAAGPDWGPTHIDPIATYPRTRWHGSQIPTTGCPTPDEMVLQGTGSVRQSEAQFAQYGALRHRTICFISPNIHSILQSIAVCSSATASSSI